MRNKRNNIKKDTMEKGNKIVKVNNTRKINIKRDKYRGDKIMNKTKAR